MASEPTKQPTGRQADSNSQRPPTEATVPTFHQQLSDSVIDGERQFHAGLEGVPAGLLASQKYRVLRKLGAGAMGVVYLAEQRSLARQVVLKVIHPEHVKNENAVALLLHDAKAAASLHHPNIVATYDVEQEGGTHFVVMGYVDGIDLQRLVKNQGRLEVHHACGLVRQAATGLQAAHEAGMVHRDIKPGNLMVSRRGVVTVLDFGLARMAGGTGGLVSVAGGVIGTPAYMAPEQADNAKAVDIRADIYSLGGTLFYLLTGQPPFPRESFQELFKALFFEEPPPLSTFRDDVPPGLAKLVVRMLAKDREKRPATPAEVARLLRPFLVPIPKSPPPPPPEKPASGTTRKGDAGLKVRLAILGVLAVALAAWLVPHFQSMLGPDGIPTPSPKAPPREKKPAAPTDFVNWSGGKMVYLKGGGFLMGSTRKKKEGEPDDEKQHKVTVSPFHLGETEVTQGQYQKVMNTNPSHFTRRGKGADKLGAITDTDDFPVENVSWHDAKRFCERLNKLDTGRPPGLVYRLPREAEWEFACRAGSIKDFCFGDVLDSTVKQANFNGAYPHGSWNQSPRLGRTCPVTTYKVNRFGLRDMHGNVKEWCEDWYDKDYYANSPEADPPGPEKRTARVVRGGCWLNDGISCRSACRDIGDPATPYHRIGFRVALVPIERK